MGGATIQINGMHTVTPTSSPSIIPQSNVSSSLDPIDLPNFDPVDDEEEALESGISNSDTMMVAEQPQMPRATVKIEGSSFSVSFGCYLRIGLSCNISAHTFEPLIHRFFFITHTYHKHQTEK